MYADLLYFRCSVNMFFLHEYLLGRLCGILTYIPAGLYTKSSTISIYTESDWIVFET